MVVYLTCWVKEISNTNSGSLLRAHIARTVYEGYPHYLQPNTLDGSSGFFVPSTYSCLTERLAKCKKSASRKHKE